MAKEEKKKHIDTDVDRQSRQLGEMIGLLANMDEHLAALVYYQQESRGVAAGTERTFAQPFMAENKKTLKDKIEELVVEELRKLNEENK